MVSVSQIDLLEIMRHQQEAATQQQQQLVQLLQEQQEQRRREAEARERSEANLQDLLRTTVAALQSVHQMSGAGEPAVTPRGSRVITPLPSPVPSPVPVPAVRQVRHPGQFQDVRDLRSVPFTRGVVESPIGRVTVNNEVGFSEPMPQNSCAVAIQDINNCDNINPLAQTSKTTLSTGSEALFSTPKRAKLSIGAAFSRVSAYAPNGDKSKQITQTIAEMITRDSLPYSMVEGIGFKKLMKTVAPLYNVPCRKTITELIDTKYEEKKTIIKQKLKSIKNICLTIDEWKDMQLRSFLGVTVHFIENYEMQSMSIACEPLHENHTGEYLSEMILKVCGDWDLSIEKIVSVTTDNGSNIVKAVEISFGRAKHIRCVAHTLNLVVDNSVKSTEVKLFLDKVRKIVTWFHQSGVGAEELRQLQTQEKIPDGKVKHLVGDVSTRWNSQLLMIERFILMSSTIGSILLKHPNAPQMLQANEIVVLKEIEKVLRPFHDVTEKMSAEKYVTASKAIPMIKCLRILLDATTIDSDLANQLKYSLQTELIKRFENIQKVHLFSVATFLDPRFKKIYLDEPLSLSKTIDYTNRYLSLNMRNDDVLAVTHSESSVSSEVTVNGQDIWKVHHEKIVSANTSTTKNTELDLYIAAPLSNLEVDPLNVWKNYEGTFPKLTNLAVKHLSVMATSAPAERLFSKAGNILRKTRNRILGKRLPKLLFLNSLTEDLWQ
ncbi:E3 SUMO-protein ligase ZBED1-like [Neodiprion lecontei]|uniref:E3 SUMO-protein ligase ZBED1-like n=1 Tax=Neodiprion lecontei TaxID=441921 RepID=A0ABM3FQA4_NEOLC|nr:E3 SUMO-protein ligase ZBED1-like [Neodiprion lecontei]